MANEEYNNPFFKLGDCLGDIYKMKKLLQILAFVVGGLFFLVVVAVLWAKSLAHDDGGAGRPTYGQPYAWVNPTDVDGTPAKQSTPEGGPVPRADGYVMGSQGNDYILPPMPPVRVTDIARRDTAFKNASIRNCFWPGPKLRSGYYTTDPDGYGEENQVPDIGNTFSTAWFKIPEGATVVMKGDFPHMRHWSFTTYTENGVPRDAVSDINIDPDAGSSNPFRAGVSRDVQPRRYTVTIANGEPPEKRPSNMVYTRAPAMTAIGMHMRNYVPDRDLDWTGGVGVPSVELHLADGKVLKDTQACDATAAPLRGKQVPIVVPKAVWLAFSNLPWRGADEHPPAKNLDVVTLQRFYNREYNMLHIFFPNLPVDFLAVEKGGFWSNLNTRYGLTFLNRAYGKVYVARGKMPTTPSTWDGNPKPVDQNADMRYWSLCTSTAAPVGNTVDCVTDENVRGTLDRDGYYNVVISQAPDRPSNATEKCGVQWMEYGNGDGIPGGSPDASILMNRNTFVNPNFKHSWFNVKSIGGEKEAMGPYMPYVLNMREKEKFEALGCPVDTSKLAAMVKQ